METFLTYYVICLLYSFFQISKTWSKYATVGGLGITPGLDSIMVVLLCWVLAPIDLLMRFVTFYKKAESARIRNSKI
jgi:hypothetical protein